jgi:lipoprotein-anchoring transpeptidase ErfK/SrfK
VSLSTNLAGVNAGNGVWGLTSRTVGFTVGDAHVSTVDIDAHQMTVTNNGAVVQTFKDSAGRDKYPTMGGFHIVLGKEPDVIMDSQTVGIPRNSPDGYYEHVAQDVNISNGGEFVHAAPWSVGAQGNSNVSHGCVNLAPSDATWFYNFSQRGDIIKVVNSPRPPDLGDSGTVDWNTSWDKWVAGSALPVL